MTGKLKQIIKEGLAKLPKEAQDAINSLDWGSIAEEIGKKYLLTESEVNDLQVETFLVLAGIEDWDSYTRNVENQLGTSKNEAEKISEEINQKIFNPIAEKMSKTTKVEETPDISPALDTRFEKVPEETKKIIIESGYHAKLFSIGTDNKLSIPQMGALEKATTGILTGSVHTESFEGKLKETLGLTDEAVKKLATEINDQILRPIRKKMEESSRVNIKIVKPPSPPEAQKAMPELNALELEAPTEKERMESEKDNKIAIQSIINRKLSGLVQTSNIKIKYALDNPPNVPSGVAQQVKTYPPKADPYRLSPEE
ncbi:hypothetical protein A3D42_02610 [Candidatus Nomurabacteria bacterium RIFCSPHIGHO2_02_FULL_41_18]|uniref:Uncharacterized protein n=1 Tax=Candidatus Nomurabacteria bacterium RIFCSPHIGHO2_02_FULL_41_18 TaxID=1801754 RepID=A0A1F6W4Y2_9BACT|nr:MAG: hypothetical protein A3D42_02610 [Candidatus Nomurabacteria bacterium RIFCSPHIGHO2_02_FULL_41_18]